MEPGQTVSPGSQQPEPNWQYNPGGQIPPPAAPEPAPAGPQDYGQQSQTTPDQPLPDESGEETITWTASEFIAHVKSPGWYATLAGCALLLAAVVFLLTRDKMSTAVVIIVSAIFGAAASRKPRELQYQVNDQGVVIGAKGYPYHNFKSFSIVQESGVESIWLMPLKRFMPIISIYFDPNDGERIVDILSQSLPMENHQPDPVDRLMHKIRF